MAQIYENGKKVKMYGDEMKKSGKVPMKLIEELLQKETPNEYLKKYYVDVASMMKEVKYLPSDHGYKIKSRGFYNAYFTACKDFLTKQEKMKESENVENTEDVKESLTEPAKEKVGKKRWSEKQIEEMVEMIDNISFTPYTDLERFDRAVNHWGKKGQTSECLTYRTCKSYLSDETMNEFYNFRIDVVKMDKMLMKSIKNYVKENGL